MVYLMQNINLRPEIGRKLMFINIYTKSQASAGIQ